jgi:hypothetical protein
VETNVDKTKFMLLSRHQNAGQNRDTEIANRSFENVSQFKYLGTMVTNQNLIQEEIKRIMNSGSCGIKKFESKETVFWFVILIPFYSTNSTITRLTHQPPSLRLYRKTTLSEQHYCYHVV